MMLYDPHREGRPDDIPCALERCKDLVSLIGGWAYLGNEHGSDMGCMGLDGVLTATNILQQTLDHVLAQYYGKCEQFQVVYERYRNKHEEEKET